MAPLGGVVGRVARFEIRRRWRALVGLALLVALVAAVSLSALAGARRTASALDRFTEVTRARDATMVVDSPEDVDRLVAALEGEDWVEAVARESQYTLTPSATTAITVAASPQAALGSTVDRPLILEGRLPEPGSIDEIAVDEAARDQLDLDVGDELTAGSFTPRTLECLITQACVEFEAGPDVPLVVTGIMRDVDGLKGDDLSPSGLATDAFFATYDGRVGSFTDQPLIRLVNGEEDLDRLRALADDVSEGHPIVVPADEDYRPAPSDAVHVFATGLVIFAVLAAAAGAVVLLQAVSRQVGTMTPVLHVLGDLGLSRGRRAATAALPVTGAAVVGGLLGVVAAAALSPLFPIAGARKVEPDPGVDIDIAVLLLGLLVFVVAMTARALWAARAASRTATHPARHQRARYRWRPPIEAAAGLRLALQRGDGPSSVPVRSALIGVVIGIAGLVGAALVAQSTEAVVTDPVRWGWSWDAKGSIVDATTIRDRLPQIADEAGVSTVALLRSGLLEVDGAELSAHALEGDDRDFDLVVVRGEPVTEDDQIALGESVMADLDVDIGDEVVVTDGEGTDHPLTVVGSYAAPDYAGEGPGSMAALTFPAWSALAQSAGVTEIVLTYDGRVDRREVDRALRRSMASARAVHGFRDA